MLLNSDNNNITSNNWDDFLSNHSKMNIFQSFDFYTVYKNASCFEPIIVTTYNEENQINGYLQAVIIKEKQGILGRFSSRCIIWGGPLIKENYLEGLDLLLKEYNRLIKKKAIYTEFRNLWQWDAASKEVFIKNGFLYKPHLDILISLNRDPDEILKDMHKGRRKNIRRAERKSLVFKEASCETEEIEAINLIKNNYKRIKLPIPDNSFFQEALRQLKKQNNVKVFVLTYNEKIIACRFVLCFNKMIYDWYAAADEDYLDSYPNDYLIWKVLEWGSLNEYSVFDFGGAGKVGKAYGVRDYKLKFGGELVEFGRFEKVHKKLLMQIGKMGLYFYKKSNHGLR
jgi:lipid II:glycine glycyltransferase (peptidoglycan interpeptide bridge formation enzyme)